MQLRTWLLHPELPTCEDCQTFLYDKSWRRSGRPGNWHRRVKGLPTPCHDCPKSRKHNQPNPAADLTARNYLALSLYHRIKAGAPMPDDGIVRRNCGLIEEVLDGVRRAQTAAILDVLIRR